MFFFDKRGRAYPISRIRDMSPPSNRDQQPDWTVNLDDDQQVQVYDTEVGRIHDAPSAFTAAAEGTFVLHYQGGSEDTLKVPVIGWALGGLGSAIPVTPDGVFDGMERTVPVLLPNGSVHWGDRGSWDSLADFEASQAREGG